MIVGERFLQHFVLSHSLLFSSPPYFHLFTQSSLPRPFLHQSSLPPVPPLPQTRGKGDDPQVSRPYDSERYEAITSLCGFEKTVNLERTIFHSWSQLLHGLLCTVAKFQVNWKSPLQYRVVSHSGGCQYGMISEVQEGSSASNFLRFSPHFPHDSQML